MRPRNTLLLWNNPEIANALFIAFRAAGIAFFAVAVAMLFFFGGVLYF